MKLAEFYNYSNILKIGYEKASFTFLFFVGNLCLD